MTPRQPQVPGALRALLEAGGSLVRRSPSGRILMARLHGVVVPEALPRVLQRGLPPALADAHAAATEPLPAKRVGKQLKALDEHDAEPLAVSATAQVHAGELDGEAVVAKVQRPGVAATVRSDLSLLDALAAPIGGVFGALDVGGVLREVREMTLDELDLEHEGSTQRQLRRILRRVEGVVVPEVRVAEQDVLITERIEGPTLADGDAGDPDEVARLLVAAHVTAAREGAVLTDPRPNHVVLLGDGRIGLLGTGLARFADRDRADAFLRAASALRDANPAAFAAIVADDLALLPAAAAERAHALLREILGDVATGPARLDAPALGAIGDRALERLGDLMALAREVTPVPSDVPAARMLGQLASVLARLGATHDWLRLATERR